MNRISRQPKPIFANRKRIGIGLALYKCVIAQTLSRRVLCLCYHDRNTLSMIEALRKSPKCVYLYGFKSSGM